MENKVFLNLVNNSYDQCVYHINDIIPDNDYFNTSPYNKYFDAKKFYIDNSYLNDTKNMFRIRLENGEYKYPCISSLKESESLKDMKQYDFELVFSGGKYLINIKYNDNEFMINACRSIDDTRGYIIMNLPIVVSCKDKNIIKNNIENSKDIFVSVPSNFAGTLKVSDFGFDDKDYRFSDTRTKIQYINFNNIKKYDIDFSPSYTGEDRITYSEISNKDITFTFFGKIKEDNGSLKVSFISSATNRTISIFDQFYNKIDENINVKADIILKLCIVKR